VNNFEKSKALRRGWKTARDTSTSDPVIINAPNYYHK